jgi:hypothetical protein
MFFLSLRFASSLCYTCFLIVRCRPRVIDCDGRAAPCLILMPCVTKNEACCHDCSPPSIKHFVVPLTVERLIEADW